ncbi:GPH family glycoside/pentoside/hexuronide:cation symporter [Streptomyces sp. DvalAA-21]|nr:GPH family glycoside/pentoside/hexuronide:cation symporter [Streptomyces sp. DvalAA-21]RAJ32337.1 GPH family glycoside/pentoside/hexuronide:cation symporter [Streptomyces sp. DpondAA-E10]RAJ47298.1 GPH family glycoside/pentoside/hexuronide:cation symporter [Streptomyces sp. DpondAA-A50]SCD45302.1 glycoside/pentoside/hexuronide:cation symporter, GPH family [Streptomyces sp. BpilaLS-43]SCE56105.1 glycoside/pentoside/hexuronide:cation symporter, GPH family [Streptomyces sp. DpondAA-F4a]SCL9569
MSPGLPRRIRVGYGLGSLCTGTFATVPGLILLYYLTDVLAVPAAVAGAAVFLPKAWDVLINPLVGALCDRSRLPGGGRRAFLLIGACTLPPLFALIFAAPPLRGAAAAGYVAVLFLLAATAYAVFQVPYVTMPAEMTEDPRERGRVLGWRVGFLGVAILLSGAVAPAIAHADGDTPASYRLMGAVVAVLLAAGMFGAWAATRGAPEAARSRAEPSLRAQLAAARSHRPFLHLAGMWTLQALAIGVMLAGVQYFATYTLGSATAVTWLFACLIGPLVLFMPLWNRLARRKGVRYAQWCASLLYTAGAAVLGLTPAAGPAVGYASVVLVGIAYAGLQLLPLTMLADTLSADAARTGVRRAATFTGLWTAAETLAFALGAGLFALVLAVTGFRSSDAAHHVSQPGAALTGIAAGMSVLPALLGAASLWLLHRYREPATDSPKEEPARAD